MLDIVIGGVLCFISTYLGIIGKMYFDKRYKFVVDFVDFLINLNDNMSYSKDNLPQIIDRYTEQNKGDLCRILSQYKSLLTKGSVNTEEINKVFNYKYLKKGERSLITEFFASLGKIDYDTQLSRLNLTKAQAEKLREKAEKESKSTGAMLSKLGLLLGIAIMILMA